MLDQSDHARGEAGIIADPFQVVITTLYLLRMWPLDPYPITIVRFDSLFARSSFKPYLEVPSSQV